MKRPSALQPRLAAAAVVGVLLSGALVWQSSYAAFTSTTRSDNNAWTAGEVLLSNSGGSSAMFTATGLVPGSEGERCLTVTYQGVAADVRLYVRTTTADLSPYLELTVDRGTGGTADCTGFTPGTPLYGTPPAFDPGLTLQSFAAAHTGYADGLAGWSPAADEVTTYRIRYRLKDDDAAQGLTSTVDFVWEAQNT